MGRNSPEPDRPSQVRELFVGMEGYVLDSDNKLRVSGKPFVQLDFTSPCGESIVSQFQYIASLDHSSRFGLTCINLENLDDPELIIERRRFKNGIAIEFDKSGYGVGLQIRSFYKKLPNLGLIGLPILQDPEILEATARRMGMDGGRVFPAGEIVQLRKLKIKS